MASSRNRQRASALDVYNRKRRFGETPEPKGNVSRARKGNLYAIQKHAARRLHYDLRLELDGVLLSWAITKGPSLDPSQKRLAVRTEDHPLEYARFEGRIPDGQYGAGPVLLWDEGNWMPDDDPREGLKAGKLTFRLNGERLKGGWALVRFKGKGSEKRENWLLIKEDDEFADRETDVTGAATDSVASGRTIDAIETHPEVQRESGGRTNRRRKTGGAPLPAFHKPALATLVDEVPEGDVWRFEVKFDGYRTIAAVSGDVAHLYSRSGLDWTARYPKIPDALSALNLNGVLLDGEVVAIDGNGRSDFGLLQDALKSGSGNLSYFIFDLLADGGSSLVRQPLTQRKARLKELLSDLPRKGPLYYVDDVSDGATLLDTLCDRGWEGIIAKHMNAPYRPGRGRKWLKVKCSKDQEFVVVGWSPSSKGRPFASILLGQYHGDRLVYAGRVGTGFSESELGRLATRFRALSRKTSPLDTPPPGAIAKSARWIRPELVAQIAFAEFTRDGLVRHGRYLGLREDKKPMEVTAERPIRPVDQDEVDRMPDAEDKTVAGIRLTHPDRVLFPRQGITKHGLAEYFDAVGERMLPYCGNRLVSLVRCPQGRQKSCFFQRHAGSGLPSDLKSMEIPAKSGGTESYLYLTRKAGLVAAAQMGVLEIHVWGSRIDDIERPERIVFDLDPGPGIDFSEVKDAATDMRDALDALGLKCFPLLTGGKGIHVVVPLMRRHEWPVVKAFAKALAERFSDHDPERFTATMSKARRTGRIFIDYLRNSRSATAIAPYSPRAREGGPVAWPVSWDVLGDFSAANIVTIDKGRERLAGRDPWEGYGSVRQGLKQSALNALNVKAA
ncbi:MAG: DNA ligase D [Alphaproteobacteria bacterium]